MLFSDRDTASMINYGIMHLQLISSEPDVLSSPSSGGWWAMSNYGVRKRSLLKIRGHR